MSLLAEFYRVVTALEAAAIPYAICGGMAVSIHGYPRATHDLDFIVERESLDAIGSVLRPLGYIHPAGIIPFGVNTKSPREVFRISKIEDSDVLTLDFILVSPALQSAWDTRQWFDVAGQRLCCVSRDGLLSMKKLAGRARDRDDIEKLSEGESHSF